MGMQPDVPASVDEEDFGSRGGAFALLGFGVKRKVPEPDCLPDDEDSTLAAELAGGDDAVGAEGAVAEADLAFEDEEVEDELAALLAQGEEPEEEDVEFEVDEDGDLDALEAPAAKRARSQLAAGDEDDNGLVDFPAEGDAAPATPPATSKSKAKAAAKAAAAPEPEVDDEEVEIEIDEVDAAAADELAQAATGEVKSKGKGKGKLREDVAAEVAVEDDWDEDDKPVAAKAGKAAGKAGKAAGKAGKAAATKDEEGFKDVFDDDDDEKTKALSKGKGKEKGLFKKGGGKDFWASGGFKGGSKDGVKGGFKGGGKGGGKEAGPEPKSVQEWAAAQARLFGNLGPLPAGWIRIRSSSTQKVYFYSTKTGESRDGDNPPAPSMPPNWQVMTSKSSGQTYYYNGKTGASQFDMPLV